MFDEIYGWLLDRFAGGERFIDFRLMGYCCDDFLGFCFIRFAGMMNFLGFSFDEFSRLMDFPGFIW